MWIAASGSTASGVGGSAGSRVMGNGVGVELGGGAVEASVAEAGGPGGGSVAVAGTVGSGETVTVGVKGGSNAVGEGVLENGPHPARQVPTRSNTPAHLLERTRPAKSMKSAQGGPDLELGFHPPDDFIRKVGRGHTAAEIGCRLALVDCLENRFVDGP